MQRKSTLLWFDSLGGLLVGLVMSVAASVLAPLYGLSIEVYWFVAIANLVYGFYSLTLISARQLPLGAVAFLSLANMTWAVICLILISKSWATISVWGIAHLAIESFVVGLLGVFEAVHRNAIARNE